MAARSLERSNDDVVIVPVGKENHTPRGSAERTPVPPGPLPAAALTNCNAPVVAE